MKRKIRIALYMLLLSVLILTGCASGEKVPTSLREGSATQPKPSPSATVTQIVPSPSATPSPTITIPPTEVPSAESTPERLSVDDIITQLDGLTIDAFFEESFKQLSLRDPDQVILNGFADEFGIPKDQFTDISDSYQRETQKLESAVLDLLRSYDRGALSASEALNYDIYEWVLDDLVRGHEFMYYDYPVNSLTIWGRQNWLIDFMANQLPIRDKQDAENYISRLSKIDTWVDQLLEGLQLREEAGAIPPEYILEETILQLEDHLSMISPDESYIEGIALYESFTQKLETIEELTPQEKADLLDAAYRETEETFIPAFFKLKDYLNDLTLVATKTSGVGRFPQGEAYYAYMLRHETGTDLTAEQFHELGLAEVARIQAEMLRVASELGYPQDLSMGSLQDQLYADSQILVGKAQLDEYNRLIDLMKGATPSYFDLLPQSDLIILEEPFGAGIGYYQSPPLDGSGPGKFFTNTNNPMPDHLIPTYVFHETIPGHHLQIALAQELALPTFRRAFVLNGYAEGWATYAERLAWEMGLYDEDPLGNLGRLDFELRRAARLVVDTGIHAKGWTRSEAAAYYGEATGSPTDPIAMNRFVVLPGQGCGYTIGMLKILELRQEAIDKLGDKFDIKAFHDVVLGSGSLPLEILEELVTEWLTSEQNN